MSSKYVKKRQVGNKTELVIDYLNFPILYIYQKFRYRGNRLLCTDNQDICRRQRNSGKEDSV